MPLLTRILVAFPAALHPTMEPCLVALDHGADEATTQECLRTLSTVPGLHIFHWSPTMARVPLTVTLQLPGGLHIYVKRRTDGCWRLSYT